ncbi:hypothetical protein SSS_05473 [Sarcoptes scabiei]|uniref:Gamma-butyrobetaine hydroxylase-like N-terminal domain-containing protein n=2 Tax=Sarcoptes scabiei TaxID=52283 RepID=A0A834RG35_SARSC|nr:hypothetical protein SSS_05473 [Sarcoptes scabiei]
MSINVLKGSSQRFFSRLISVTLKRHSSGRFVAVNVCDESPHHLKNSKLFSMFDRKQSIFYDHSSPSRTVLENEDSLTKLDNQLEQVKVFQEEQIIQLTFLSGKSINYTMAWLRNICSCLDCTEIEQSLNDVDNEDGNVGKKFQHQITTLSVARVQYVPGSSDFMIEWIDQDYRCHWSTYCLKRLEEFRD